MAKVYGHYITVNYRESYDLFACSGILFNHESPRRGLEFVTRKITRRRRADQARPGRGAALGNLDAKRDWGFAGDYVRAMWLMLQQDEPDDYVIGTGRDAQRRPSSWSSPSRTSAWTGSSYVVIDPQFIRPAEVDLLVGDPTKARERLGWEPRGRLRGARPDDGRRRPRAPRGPASAVTIARGLSPGVRFVVRILRSMSGSRGRLAAPTFLRRRMQVMYERADADYRGEILAHIPPDPHTRLLDVGCDDGAWTAELAARAAIPPDQVSGIEIVDARRALAEARGFDVRPGDLDEDWPFEDAVFDVVHANQVIEHVHRLDHFVTEVRRVLRPGGRAIICTENLASWHNIGALIVGWMPVSLANVQREADPWATRSRSTRAQQPARGRRGSTPGVLSLSGLRSIFPMHGLEVTDSFGTGYHPLTGRVGRAAARADLRHAHFIGVVVRRPA